MQYDIELYGVNGEFVGNAVHNGQNAIEALEDAINQGLVNVYDGATHAVVRGWTGVGIVFQLRVG